MKAKPWRLGHGPSEPDDPAGVEPVRMHIQVPADPARGKSPRQERSAGEEHQSPVDTDRRRDLKPRSQSDRTRIRSFSNTGTDHPTKINRGARSDEPARGPGRSEMTAHPMREQTCEGRMRTPRALPTEQREGPLGRPGRERLESVAEHRARADDGA